MEQSKVIDRLEDLVKTDVDASYAYQQAIENIKIPEVSRVLEEYRQDHERHARRLSDEIERLGGERPSHTRSITGFFMSGFTTIRSATGTEGALKAMESNEYFTNRAYEKASNEDFPAETLALIMRHLDDERQHLSYIQRTLRGKVWEKSA